MQYMLMIFSEEGGWARLEETEQRQAMAAYYAYTEALQKARAFITTNRLQPSSAATTVRISNGKAQVLDGPYAEAKEQFGGFYIIEAPDLDAALSWAARCPGAIHGVVEVRPIWPADV